MTLRFQTVMHHPAGLPDHALVEDQRQDIATDVKFRVGRLKETQMFIGLASQTRTLKLQWLCPDMSRLSTALLQQQPKSA